MTSVTMRNPWTLFVTTACVAILGGCAACRAPRPQDSREKQAEYEITLDLLEQAHKLMREVAEEHLPRGDVGEEVQAKQRRIIRNFDMIVTSAQQNVASLRADNSVARNVQDKEGCLAQSAHFHLFTSIVKQMVSDQREVVCATKLADKERLAFEEKNPSREFKFSQGLCDSIDKARLTEEDLAQMSKTMARFLYLQGKFIFPTVFDLLREDMYLVVSRLAGDDVGEETQLIEEDILRNLQRLIQAVHRDLRTLRRSFRDDNADTRPLAASPGNVKPNKTNAMLALSSLDVRFLKILQIQILSMTLQLSEAYKGGIETIESRERLLRGDGDEMKRAADEYKVNLSRRLAAKQSRVAELVRELIDAIKKPDKKEAEQ